MAQTVAYSQGFTLATTQGFTQKNRRKGEVILTGLTGNAPDITLEPINSSLPEVNNQLYDLAKLKENWDSYGALPPTQQAITKASDFLRLVYEYLRSTAKTDAQPHRIAPLPDGGIHLSWKRPQAETEVEFGPEGTLNFMYVEQEDREDKFVLEDEDVPWWMVLKKIEETLLRKA